MRRPNDPRDSVAVPCNGCTACCHCLILVSEDNGDEPGRYLTRSEINPLTGAPALFLAQRPDGACVYLGAKGCTIHGRAPAICRAYDCRAQYRAMPAKLRHLVMHPDIRAAAKARLNGGPPP